MSATNIRFIRYGFTVLDTDTAFASNFFYSNNKGCSCHQNKAGIDLPIMNGLTSTLMNEDSHTLMGPINSIALKREIGVPYVGNDGAVRVPISSYPIPNI